MKIADQVAQTNAVTFTDVGDLVGLAAHGLTEGALITFTAINTTTGISTGTNYYVRNPSTNSFEVATTVGGTPLALTGDGTGTMSHTPVQARGLLTCAYWSNVGAWTSFVDVVDETDGFSRSGFIVWENMAQNWVKKKPADISGITSYAHEVELYWVKFTLADNPTAAVLIDAVKFLLSDDRYLNSVFPGIQNYIPSGQTDFMPQHETRARRCG